MKHLSSKKRVAAVAAVVLLLLFIFRPGASRLKSRIVLSISSAVGRPVDIGSVHLRMLPRPGFDLDNLVVYDDPAFGAEPILRATEVTAALRLMSLVRLRLEIARLDLTEPSLNLVRGANGRWNLETLLERTAHTPLAPTAKAKSEPRPGFPYIAATSARINFKNGVEKRPYALTNADFSLWQESENEWGVRLKAQPLRTDLNLSDTGLLRVDGIWQRADSLRDTPLQFSMEWNRAQLGQVTKFFTGNDQGWRGEVQVDAVLSGTPAKLQVTSNASVEDFRRYDLASGHPLRLTTHCEGLYRSPDHMFRDVTCHGPVEGGQISLKGSVGLPGTHIYDLTLTAEKVPVSAMTNVAQRVKKNLPDDLIGAGILNGTFSIRQNEGESRARAEGKGEVTGFRVASATAKASIGPEDVPLVLNSGETAVGKRKKTGRRVEAEIHMPDGPRIEFGPFPVAIGRTQAPDARGWINQTGYGLLVSGDADISKALRAAAMVGLPALQAAVEGTAEVDLLIAGSWAGRTYGAGSNIAAPEITGSARLHNVRVEIRGVGGPIEVPSADLLLLQEETRVEKLAATAAGANFSGSVSMPRGCATLASCQVHFSLNASQIALSELNLWLNPPPKERPWYRVLQADGQAGPSFLENLRATGSLTADRLQVQSLAASRMSAKVTLDSGKIEIADLKADFMGGQHRGSWRADFSMTPAVCSGSGKVAGISLSRLAEAMKDPWISGTANVGYELKGACPAGFWPSAEGSVQFDARNGSLPHLTLAESAGPLKLRRFSGRGTLQAGKLTIQDATLDSASGSFQVSGTATVKRELEIKLTKKPTGAAYAITGTLAQPRVVQSAAETQAKLNAQPAK